MRVVELGERDLLHCPILADLWLSQAELKSQSSWNLQSSAATLNIFVFPQSLHCRLGIKSRTV